MQSHRLLPFAFAALFAACGDDTMQATPDGGGSGSATPVYVGATRVFSGDTSAGYLFTTSSLEAGTQIDLGSAIEIEDGWVFGDADPYFYTATIFAPEITRWTLDDTGKPVRGPTVSFANAGVAGTYTAASTPVFSPTKSYFVDSESNQIVVWNPTEMTFLKAIPLDIPAITDMVPTLEIAVRTDRVFVTVFWVSPDSKFTQYGDHVRILAIDPATDTVTETTDDSRCQSISPSGVTSDGTAYFSPWDYHATVRGVFGTGYGSASCGLRVVPAGTDFDAGYIVDLSSLVGGKPAGGLRLTSDTEALIHVWNADLVPATPTTWSADRFKPGYTWYRWHLGDTTATPLPDQQPSTEGGEWKELDGMTVSYNPNGDYTETTLVELGAGDALKTHVTIPGWIVNMVRAR